MKDIIGYEDKYAVDKDGTIWSLNFRRSGRTQKLKPCINSNGYLHVILCKDGKRKTVKVHRLIAQAYLSDFCKELDVDHIDRDRLNNNLSNLRMVTTQQNMFNTKAKGYYWNKRDQKWLAQIKLDGKKHHLGYFDKEEDARQAYLDSKKILHKM